MSRPVCVVGLAHLVLGVVVVMAVVLVVGTVGETMVWVGSRTEGLIRGVGAVELCEQSAQMASHRFQSVSW